MEKTLMLGKIEGGRRGPRNCREMYVVSQVLLPWTARRSNQSVLKEINPEYSLEELMLNLWPPDAKSQLIGKDPEAGKD